jgi:hypothetical protein
MAGMEAVQAKRQLMTAGNGAIEHLGKKAKAV